jgi:hypothetical protein
MSSAMTIAFPRIWILGGGAMLLADWRLAGQAQGLTAWLVTAALIVLLTLQLKRVGVDDKCLHVSNYRKEICIPFGNIADVTKSWLTFQPGGRMVTVHLRTPTEFGSKIRFWPNSVTVADEIKQLANISMPPANPTPQ